MVTLTIYGSGVLEIYNGTEQPQYITARNGDLEIRDNVFFLQDKVFDKEYYLGTYDNVVGFASKAALITYLGDFFSAAGTVTFPNPALVGLYEGTTVGFEDGSQVRLADSMDNLHSVQNPLPTDGDSVYEKDINEIDSTIGTFTGDILTLFNDYDVEVTDVTVTNPKTYTLWFKRPLSSAKIGIGSKTGNFSNVKLLFYDMSGALRYTKNDSANNTKYTSNVYSVPPIVFIGLKVEFHTADAVKINGMYIPKDVQTVARLQALKPDGTVTDIDATTSGNLKVSLEEFDSAFESTPLPTKPILQDEFGNEGRMLSDNVFLGAPVIIDVEHHEIHCGDSYVATRTLDLGNGASDTMILNVPALVGARNYHAVFEVLTESEASFAIFEGATTAADGVAVPFYNRNRNSAFTTGVTLFHTPTTPAGGTEIFTAVWGSGRGVGGESRGREEFILKNNTKYRIVLTNNTATANQISYKFSHYIHADA